MPKWLLPTLSEILTLSDPTWVNQELQSERPDQRRLAHRMTLKRLRAEREWSGAVAALSAILHQKIQDSTASFDLVGSKEFVTSQGFVLSGPLPVLSDLDLITHLSTWTLTANPLNSPAWMPYQLLPASEPYCTIGHDSTTSVLSLLPGDPLGAEQFCLVLTQWFSLVMVLGEKLTGEPAFMFSFMPEVAERAWEAIRPRVLLTHSHQIDRLDDLVHHFVPVAPNYQMVMQFSRLMLEHLPDFPEDGQGERLGHMSKRQEVSTHKGVEANPLDSLDNPLNNPLPHTNAPDIELLQAIAHEVRTPLTTIRTLTRSLLRRQDLSPDVLKRLEIIDRECSEQIDRFGLIFRAVELETSSMQQMSRSLTRTSVVQVFQQSIPRWKQQASQRNLTLDVVLPQNMPAVVSDPTLLDKALTSLIERFTRSLPPGSHIRVEVMLAGNQLKLQLQSQPVESDRASSDSGEPLIVQEGKRTPLKSLGQMLMFQPETGSLSLNLSVTKTIFQSLGGKLIVRERPQQGEIMTVFLPLEMGGSSVLDTNILDI